MSKELVSQSQIMKQTCEGCGASKTWELVGVEDGSPVLAEMQEWYVVGRKIIDPNGRPVSISADACSLACVPAAAVNLALPKFKDQPADDIDLASLRVSNLN